MNVQLLGVGTREPYQVERLRADGFAVDLLLDSQDQLRRAVGADHRFAWWRVLHPGGATAYVRAARQAKRFDPIWSEANQRPGLVLLDADLNVLWSRIGNRLGDYPSADEVITTVSSILTSE